MEHDGTVSQRSFNEEKLESATAAGVSVKNLVPEVSDAPPPAEPREDPLLRN